MESSLSGLTAAIQGLNTSITSLNKSYEAVANRQRNFQRQQRESAKAAQEQTSSIGGLNKVLFGLAQGVQAASAITGLTQEFQGFANVQQNVIKFLQRFGKDADKTPTKLDDISRALGRFFAPVTQIENVRREFVGIGGVLEGVEQRTTTVANGLRTVESVTTDAAGIIKKGFVEVSGAANNASSNIIKGARQTKQALDQTREASQKIFGPGTTSLQEFASQRPLLERFTTFISQAFQNVRFHITRAFSAPLESLRSFGTAISQLFASVRSGVSGFGSLGNAITSIQTKFRELVDRISVLRERGGPLGQILGLIGDRLRNLGPGGAAGVAAAGLGLVSSAAGKAILNLAQKASDLQESVNAMNVTLGDAAPRFNELIGDTSKLGLTQLELNEALTPVATLLQGAGKSGDDLAVSLNNLSRRAVDVGSIFNKTTGDVLVKFGAAIRGEIEPARALGITFNAAAVEAEAAAQGFEEVDGQFSEQAKTLARLNLVLKQTNIFAGDYARTSQDLANATRNFRTVLAELGFEFSAAFLPAAEKVRAALNDLVTAAGPKASLLFKALTPLITVVGVAIAGLTKALTALFTASNDVTAALRAIFSFIVDQLGNLTLVKDVVISIAETFQSTFGPAVEFIARNLHTVQEILGSTTRLILTGIVALKLMSVAFVTVGTKVSLVSRLFVVLQGILLRLGATQAAAAVTSLSTSLAAAAGPLTLVATGIVVIVARLQQLKSNAEAAANAITADNFNPEALEGFSQSLSVINQDIEQAQQKLEKGFQIKVFGFRIAPFKDVNKEIETLNALENERIDIVKRQEVQTRILNEVARSTGESLVDVLERANAAGIDFTNLPFNRVDSTIKSLVQGFKAVGDSLEELEGVFSRVVSASRLFDQLLSVQEQINSANQSLNDLIRQRDQLLGNVVAQQLEEFNAAKSVRDIQRQIEDTIKERADLVQQILDIDRQRTQIENDFLSIAQERLDIEAKIRELLEPPSPEELQEGADRVTRAQINLNKAKREELKLQEEILNKVKEGEDLQLNLAGLSLDEVRSRVASARAAAAAQRARKKEADSTDELLTDEEKLQLAAINTRDAQRELNNIQEDFNKLQKPEIANREQIQGLQQELVRLTDREEDLRRQIDGLLTDEENIKIRIQRIDEDAPGLILQKQSAEQEYQAILNGEVGIQETIRNLTANIKQQRLEIRNLAQEEQTTLDKIRLGEEAVEAVQIRRNLERLKELGLIDDTANRLDSLAKRETGKIVEAALSTVFTQSFAQTDKGQQAADRFFNQVINNPQVISRLTDALLVTPGADLKEVLTQILRELNINIPGFSAEGSVVTGSPGPLGQLMHVGEYSKPEAILPLTKPGRFASVLQQSLPYAHPAIRNMIGQMYEGSVLDGAPRISLTGGKSQSLRARKPTYASGSVPFQSAKPTRLEQKLDRLIQLQEEANEKDVGINAPITIQSASNPDLTAKKTIRELERQLRRGR